MISAKVNSCVLKLIAILYFFGSELVNFFSYHTYSLYDRKVDGYRWYQNETKLIRSSDPKFQKIYFSIVLPSGRDLRFKHHAYFLLDSMRNS